MDDQLGAVPDVGALDVLLDHDLGELGVQLPCIDDVFVADGGDLEARRLLPLRRHRARRPRLLRSLPARDERQVTRGSRGDSQERQAPLAAGAEGQGHDFLQLYLATGFLRILTLNNFNTKM